MKVLVRAVLAGVVALMMIMTVVPAASAVPEGPPPPGKWLQYRVNQTFSAGTACKHAVHVRNRGAYRVIPVKAGGVIEAKKNWSYSKFRKKGSKRWVRLPAGGDARFAPTADPAVGKTVVWGANWTGAIKGVYGIVWTRGLVTSEVNGINTPDWQDDYFSDLDVSKAKHVRQVCYMIGSKPVWGKSVPPLG